MRPLRLPGSTATLTPGPPATLARHRYWGFCQDGWELVLNLDSTANVGGTGRSGALSYSHPMWTVGLTGTGASFGT